MFLEIGLVDISGEKHVDGNMQSQHWIKGSDFLDKRVSIQNVLNKNVTRH